MAMSHRLTTNSLDRRILRIVSFSTPSGRVWMPRITIGGSCENTLKKLIGAAFGAPSALAVVTSAMGRGATKLHSRR